MSKRTAAGFGLQSRNYLDPQLRADRWKAHRISIIIRTPRAIIPPVPGSGTGSTVTAPGWTATGILEREESSSIASDTSSGLIPAALPRKAMVTSEPSPLAPMTGPTSVSAIPLMIPAVLSIVPEKKEVGPALSRNGPSSTAVAERIAGSNIKLKSEQIHDTGNVNA